MLRLEDNGSDPPFGAEEKDEYQYNSGPVDHDGNVYLAGVNLANT
ncbi:FimD/PapC C-terminal domain-containing protein [Escherichia coli]